jgi:hypothetical protein
MPAAGGAAGGLVAGGFGGLPGSGGVSGLEPYPTDSIGCHGENHGGSFGLHGQCCVSVKCLPLTAGVCPPTSYASPPGSGSCGCVASPLEEPVMGPYAPTAADTANADVACCYLVAAIGCDGRPLLVEGRALLGPVVARADWSARRA